MTRYHMWPRMMWPVSRFCDSARFRLNLTRRNGSIYGEGRRFLRPFSLLFIFSRHKRGLGKVWALLFCWKFSRLLWNLQECTTVRVPCLLTWSHIRYAIPAWRIAYMYFDNRDFKLTVHVCIIVPNEILVVCHPSREVIRMRSLLI